MRCCFVLSMVCLFAGFGWSQSVVFEADQATWQEVREGIQQEVILEGVFLDGMRSGHVMRLQPLKVWAEDAVIRINTAEGVVVKAAPTHTYLRGYLDASPNSRVVLSITDQGRVKGIVTDAGRIWMLEGATHDVVANVASREAAWSEIAEDGGYLCGADGLPGASVAREALSVVNEQAHEITYERNRRGGATYTATVAYETDEEFLSLFANATEAEDYIGDLTAFMSTVYSDEVDTAMEVGLVSLWDGESDPWDEPGTACTLLEFGKHWNDNNTGVDRTIAHFLSGRNMGGGIAWVGVLCNGAFNTSPANVGATCNTFSGSNNYGGDYGVSANLVGNFNINNPTSVWDIVVVSHEIGHNFNSPHTHCYANLEGNANPIDECYGSEGGCYNGGTSLPCGQSGAGCGTIMSYCHLLGGGLGNISLTLGLGHAHGTAPERVPTRMNAHVVNIAGFNAECLQPQICAAPSVTQQPSGSTVCVGSPLAIGLAASGTGLSYQWQLDTVDIPGATSATYSVSEAALSDSGSYRCVITGECGSVNSNAVTVTVSEGASITGQPNSLERCVGESATFSVTASGSVTGYQWLFNGQNIGGATQASLVLDNLENADAGSYTCEVSTSDCGVLVSSAATLTINQSASIISQPTSLDRCTGEFTQFSVTASGAGLNYQWRFNGTPIAGATQSSYVVGSAELSDAGEYDCLVGTSTCPGIASNIATLSVNESLNIATQPEDASACVGGAVNFAVLAAGGNLTYQWRFNGQDIDGANSATYNIAAATLNDAGAYTCFITSSCGDTTTETANLSVVDGLVLIQGPTNLTRCETEFASFTVVADGSGLSYQWKLNDQNIVGATSATYSINAVNATHVGSYLCEVTSDCGAVSTQAVTLTMNPLPAISQQPQGVILCTGEMVLLTVGVSGTGTVAYQWLKDGQEIAQANSANYQILAAQPDDSGVYTCRVSNACGGVRTAAASVSVADEAQLVLDHEVKAQAGVPVSVGFSFGGCQLDGPTWVWRNAQTQEVYGSDVHSLTLPLFAQTTTVELLVTANGFSASAFVTVLVTDDGDYYDPNGDGCLDGDDVVHMGQFWLGVPGPDADGNGRIDVRDFAYLDTTGDCPGLPITAKVGLKP